MSIAPPTAVIVPAIALDLFHGRRFAVDTSAPVMQLPVFAHRPMGTQF